LTVLAFITRQEDAHEVVRWAMWFAAARNAPLHLLCWSYAPYKIKSNEPPSGGLAREVQRIAQDLGAENHVGIVEVQDLAHPDPVEAALGEARGSECEMLVTAAFDVTSPSGDEVQGALHPILHGSPCTAVVLYCRPNHIPEGEDVFVRVTDGPHDSTGLFLANAIAEITDADLTLARTEEFASEADIEVGKRELSQMIRDAGITDDSNIQTEVFGARDYAGIRDTMDNHALVVLGSNASESLGRILRFTSNPTIALIKRAPALKTLTSMGSAELLPRLSPADYTDLVQGLRRGSRLNTDFIVMLGLAAAIASLGLIQSSPAVVIGSMLLAPLMTPMLGCGLALSMGNAHLAKQAATAITVGFLFTLVISFAVGLLTPGAELTPEIVARADPNILDLLIAAASGAAAAYALARPGLAGSVAGVAIATALVPPLCTVGIALAYLDLTSAWGACLLFNTNVVAIILGASAVFRVLGITSLRRAAPWKPRVWVQRTVTSLAVGALIMAIPLQLNLLRHLDEGKPQPNAFPVAKRVLDELHKYVATIPELELLTAGRPASEYSDADVMIVLTSPRPISRRYAERIAEIVRRTVGDDTLKVVVHGLLEAWETVETVDPEETEEAEAKKEGDTKKETPEEPPKKK
jgi:uncharacterized hydrophobic protein (TIGR00271 family)